MKKILLLMLVLFTCAGAYALPTISFLEQTQYRWRNNDGSETTATWKAAANTQITQSNFNEILRLRAEYYCEDLLTGSLPLAHGISYSKDGGATWVLVDESSSNDFMLVPSALVANGTNTTNQMGSATGGTFVAGKVVSQDNPSTATTMADLTRTEKEWVLKPTLFCENNTTYLFESASVTTPVERAKLITDFNCVPPVVTVAPSIVRCSPGTFQLEASIDTPAGSMIVWWTAASGGTIIGTGPSVTSPAYNTSTTVYVQGFRNGCRSTRIPVELIVDEVPLSIDLNDGMYCVTNELQVTTSPAYPATYTYAWNTGAQTADISLMPTLGVANQYWVSVTSPHGCVNSDTVMLEVNPLPEVNLGDDTLVCVGEQIVLDAGNPGATYLWNTGDQTQTITVDPGATYSVDVTNMYNCTTTDAIFVEASPIATIDGFNFIPRFDIEPGRVDFVAINPVQVNSYLWDFGDGTTSTLPNPTHVYAASGTYEVSLQVDNPCGPMDTSLVISVDLVLGISAGKLAAADLNVYPVPASAKLTVAAQTDDVFLKNITLFNVVGQQLAGYELHNSRTYDLDLSAQAAGNYFIRVETNKGAVYRRFNIAR